MKLRSKIEKIEIKLYQNKMNQKLQKSGTKWNTIKRYKYNSYSYNTKKEQITAKHFEKKSQKT